MAAGLRRVTGTVTSSAEAGDELLVDPDGGLVEVLVDERSPVIEVTEGIVGAGQFGSLTDLELDPGDVAEPFVLVRDPDTGIYHSRRLGDVEQRQRGSVVHYLERDPPHVLPEEWQVGDWIAVIAGDNAGQVYRVVEE